MNDMRNELDAGDHQEGWKSNPVEDSKNSKESKGSTCANLHMLFVVSNAVDEDKTPEHYESFDAVGECMRLICPGDVGGRDQRDGDSSVS
jgi:hypothetical protein